MHDAEIVRNAHAQAVCEEWCVCSSWAELLILTPAGLRRSFRLSRKDRQGSSGEDSEVGEPDFLTYEEVTRYQHRSSERPRLVVLIGKSEPLEADVIFIYDIQISS